MAEQLVQQEGDGSIPFPPLQSGPDLYLEFCSRSHPAYRAIRDRHYVENKGAHGQQVHFLIWYRGVVAGIISGGSAVYATPVRDEFFGINQANRECVLNGVVNNIVFRLEVFEKNLGTRVLALWRKTIPLVWEDLYGVPVFGFETLIIEDRTAIAEGGVGTTGTPVFKSSKGALYRADNWMFVGKTEGNTKHHDGVGLNESYGRTTVTKKLVFCKWRDGCTAPIESVYLSSWQASKKWSPTLERRLKRQWPEVTQELWEAHVPVLKARAKALAVKRKQYLGVMFYSFGKRLYKK